MRAVRLVEAQRLEVVEMPEPEPKAGELVLRVAACGICGSDLTSFKRGLFIGVPGHEVAGVVEAVGADAGGWRPGEAVVIGPATGCGACDQCRTGNYHRCILSLTGSGTTRPGGYAELMAAAVHRVRRLPEGLDPEVGCLAEPLSVAVHGVERSCLQPGQDVAVVGLGSIGLLAVAALRWRNAGGVFGIDPVDVRRQLALELGASAVFSRASDALAETDGAPVVLECSGRPEAIQQAADLARPGGRVVLVGIAVAEVTVVPVFWITRELTLTGSINSRHEDFVEAIELLTARPAVTRIVTRRITLEEVPATFELLLRPSGVGKVVIDPRL